MPPETQNCRELEHDMQVMKAVIQGSGADAPGLVSRVALIERVMFGKEQQEGMVYKVNILWRMHLWVLCTLSGLAGFALREAVRLVWKV